MRSLFVPAVAMCAALVFAATTSGRAGQRFSDEPNTDRSGNDFRVVTLAGDASAAQCRELCAGTTQCVAFTFVKRSATVPAPVCRLKDAAPFGHESSCCSSGRRLD